MPDPAAPSALIVDDDLDTLDVLTAMVERSGFEAHPARNVREARTLMSEARMHLALLDLELPDGSGLDLIKDLEADHGAEVVVITAFGSLDSAVEAFRAGVADYLTKPVELPRLRILLDKVQRSLEMRDEIRRLRAELRGLGQFGEMVGACEVMQTIYDRLQRVAPTDATVLLTGETGTGKELAAHTIHALSRRAKRPFVAINCSATAPNLIESELFGHEKGAFTGALRSRAGIFERAHGGTLFLDEIAETSSDLQVKLLRVLETSTLRRVGGDRDVQVDVRVIAATNRDPETAQEEGRFRRDLFYRLNVFPISLPPLRERGDDIVLIAERFLARLNREHEGNKRLAPAALDLLRAHSWPGNVRELRNVLERAYIMAADDRIDAEPLSLSGALPRREPTPLRAPAPLPPGTPLAELERVHILATLDRCDGNRRAAARLLGISLTKLYDRLRAYGRSD